MTTPHWRIWVDWDDDGVWGEDNEDLTADVQRFDWRWGRGQGNDHAAPARLNLDLRNDSQKYSPPNSNSALAGNLKTGRRLWAQFAYPYDDFSGGVDPAGQSLPVGDGFSWVKHNLGANGFTAANGQLQAVTGGSADAIYTVDFADADAHLGLHYQRNSDAGGGLVLRLASPFNYLRVRFGATGTVLERVAFGAVTSIRSGNALTAGVNYFMEVDLHGPSVRLFVTDLDAGASERQEILDGAGSAGNLTATRHGLWHNGSAATDRWSHFGGWRSFFHGQVDSIVPNPGQKSCRLTAFDALQNLESVRIYNLITGNSVRSGSVAGSILNWAGFTAADRQLEQGQVLVSSGPRAVWRTTARQGLNAVQEEEDGFIYVDGRGYLRLEAAGHRDAAPHTASRVTLNTAKASSPYLSGLTWDDGSDGLENSVSFRYRRLESHGLQEIWRLREVAAIPAGETQEFLAESSDYDAVESVRTPLANTDYTANSAADGTGTDLTSSLTVTLIEAAKFQGRGRLVRVVNGHATATAYVTLLKLRADRAYKFSEPTIYQTQETASQTAHGERAGEVDCRFIDNYAAAQSAAGSRLARKKERKPRLTLTLPNGDGKNLMQMVHRTLSDRVTVVYSDMGINQDFFIEGMELRVVARTGEMTARWLVQGV